MISLRHVSRAYPGVAALDDVSFDIAAGEFTAITGPSGCGKSTLLHLIGGMDAPDAGEIVVDGLALHRASERELTAYRRTRLGVVFQFFHLLPTMTVLENASLPLLLAGEKMSVATARARELIETVGLAERASHFPHQLSGGEMQRAAIARALAHRPAVLLADEPTGNLDSASAGQVLELLQKIASDAAATVVVVTHSEDVAGIAARRLRMRDGKMTEGTP